MTDRTPFETTNLDRYGHAELPRSRPRDLLAAGPPEAAVPDGEYFFVLGTCRPDGRPHAASVGALWHDGDLYFTSGPGTRESRNLDANPACTLTARLADIDLVPEAEAARVADRTTLEAVAARYWSDAWPVEVDGGAFTAPYSAPSAGPPPWLLYRFTFHTAFGVAAAEPHGATRWRFGPRPGA